MSDTDIARITPWTTPFIEASMQSKLVFSISQTGQVTLGEGFTADDASRHFIEQMSGAIGKAINDGIDERLRAGRAADETSAEIIEVVAIAMYNHACDESGPSWQEHQRAGDGTQDCYRAWARDAIAAYQKAAVGEPRGEAKNESRAAVWAECRETCAKVLKGRSRRWHREKEKHVSSGDPTSAYMRFTTKAVEASECADVVRALEVPNE